MKLTPLKIAKAKQTRFGRMLCRLFGDERGAVMMEYVVLGVLIVAAVVGIVMVFSTTVRDQFTVMIDTLTVGPQKAQENLKKRREARQKDIETIEPINDSLGLNDTVSGD